MTNSHSSPAIGKVYLVGAGPGDPGLITVRGAACLAEAELVLYDGLVNPLLLRLTHGVCERTARARREGHAIVPQSEINARLIAEARAGQVVVRLKGGDPFIFGRGSEEAAALQEAGIPFEVVPGITAATAAGEYAGFSFTHREISSAVAFITGHEDPEREATRLDFRALAAFPGTLVFYMGLSRLAEICRQLQAAGMPETTPAAVVCHASLASQQVVEGTLHSLPALAIEGQLKPPSLIVVGPCVTQRARLSWFEQLPLFGVSIGVTRPDEQSDDIADRIFRLGGEPVLMPMIEVGPLDESQSIVIAGVLNRLQEFDWLTFTSVNGVSEFFRHLYAGGLDARALHHAKIAVIGASTAKRLLDYGLKADLMPAEFRAESLAAALVELVSGKSVLWLRANRGRDVLPTVLSAAVARFEQLVVYENRDVSSLTSDVVQRIKSGSLDWIGLSSPSIARRFAELARASGIEPQTLPTKLASISPVTSAAANDCGLIISAEAKVFTWDGIIDAIRNAAVS